MVFIPLGYPITGAMKSLFADLFTYHHHFNQKLISEFKTHGAKLPERSFPLWCHVLNAHQIWNARILKTVEFKVHQLHELDQLPAIDNTNYTATLRILDKANFDSNITYKNSKGQEFTNTLRDILLHVANHTTHHRGQIISDFRQVGIEPLVTDYIFFRRG
jgi:uncharacterized damage-inducible protein DinB